jgi:phosphoribosyl-AMP cyclohydrolase
MLAYMNQEAFEATLATGTATYYSRSRQKLWIKGETSGNVQRVKEIRVDCDDDTLVLKVEQIGGAACHTGHRSCFHKKIDAGAVRIIGEPLFDPKEVYKK